MAPIKLPFQYQRPFYDVQLPEAEKEALIKIVEVSIKFSTPLVFFDDAPDQMISLKYHGGTLLLPEVAKTFFKTYMDLGLITLTGDMFLIAVNAHLWYAYIQKNKFGQLIDRLKNDRIVLILAGVLLVLIVITILRILGIHGITCQVITQ